MKKSSAFVMVVPGLVILVVCLFLPLLKVLVPTLFASEYPLSSYVDFFLDEYYLKIFARTVKVAVITTAACMAAGVPTAYFISRCSRKWRGILLAVSIFPMMTNSVIRSFAWINILGSNGIMNRFLMAAGFADKPVKLLYTDFAIIIGSVYLFLLHRCHGEHGGRYDGSRSEPGRQPVYRVSEGCFPHEPSGNYCGRYPRVYRNADSLYYTAAAGRQ